MIYSFGNYKSPNQTSANNQSNLVIAKGFFDLYQFFVCMYGLTCFVNPDGFEIQVIELVTLKWVCFVVNNAVVEAPATMKLYQNLDCLAP